ncbi:Hypothetical protein POVR1_LOCUS185 [uncultured virus]|nr:Hypothetical protein POVR1_LOCUS185 [uncultured virus]
MDPWNTFYYIIKLGLPNDQLTSLLFSGLNEAFDYTSLTKIMLTKYQFNRTGRNNALAGAIKYGRYEIVPLLQQPDIPKEYKLHITLHDVNDINFVKLELESSSSIITNVYIKGIVDPDMLLKNGLVPHPETDMPKRVLILKFNGVPDDVIEYWVGVNPSQLLREIKVWTRYSPRYVQNSINNADSYPLLYAHSQLMYSNHHPITNMSLFNPTKLHAPPEKFLPVTRYATGMHRGLFFGDTPANCLGTFYYHQSESNTFLSYDRILEADNKYHAAVLLQDDSQELKMLVDVFSKSGWLYQWVIGNLRKNLMYSPIQAYEELNIRGHSDPYKATQHPIYAGGVESGLGIYGREDCFDQPLCRAARRQGYDCILFKSMAGSQQIVGEVLDVRDRSISFASLFTLQSDQ